MTRPLLPALLLMVAVACGGQAAPDDVTGDVTGGAPASDAAADPTGPAASTATR